jgi:RimJ/RimL family protein N-acetyltransferase
MRPCLQDDTLCLRPPRIGDAVQHWAGDDAEQVRWLSGQAATLDSARAWIERELAARAAGDPLWDYAIQLRATGELVGNIEAKADLTLVGIGPGDVNLAYVIFPAWRRRGLAARAVVLVCEALAHTEFERAVIRTDPHNVASIGVALRAGFASTGLVGPESDRQLKFIRRLR